MVQIDCFSWERRRIKGGIGATNAISITKTGNIQIERFENVIVGVPYYEDNHMGECRMYVYQHDCLI